MGTVMETGRIQGSMYANPETSRGIADVGKEQAQKLSGAGRRKVFEQLDARKQDLVQAMEGLVSNLERGGSEVEGWPKQVLTGAASYLHRATGALTQSSSEELLEQTQDKFRQRPALFLAGLFAAGLFAGRLVRR